MMMRAEGRPNWLGYCTYNPELFPGMCIRMKDGGNCVMLVFNTGKCVITGGHSEEEIHTIFFTIYQDLLIHFLTK